ISPLLANIFLHYILDLWIHQWRRRRARGRVVAVRYADDFVMGFENKAEAQEMLLALKARLASFGLMLHEGKTRLIEFGRFAALSPSGAASGDPRPSPSSASPTTAGGPGTAGLS
ncbi:MULTISPECIES: reverse transcriptase domain-containing protein, partial [unclassified Bradyrhizobium]|uniref:reverse transcriptase domain-containing protein n=1 Tax=unclassified Bradyrhizobium TaxID=2631580 RepID=UPI001FF90E9F